MPRNRFEDKGREWEVKGTFTSRILNDIDGIKKVVPALMKELSEFKSLYENFKKDDKLVGMERARLQEKIDAIMDSTALLRHIAYDTNTIVSNTHNTHFNRSGEKWMAGGVYPVVRGKSVAHFLDQWVAEFKEFLMKYKKFMDDGILEDWERAELARAAEALMGLGALTRTKIDEGAQ